MMFAIGEKVIWTSQAGGRSKTKEGEIHEVVPAHAIPATRLREAGAARNHVSYIVKVGPKFYWPLVSKLKELRDKP